VSAFVGQWAMRERESGVSANLHIVLAVCRAGWLLVGLMSRPLPRAAELSIAHQTAHSPSAPLI